MLRTLTFSRRFSTAQVARADILKDLYLAELRKYSPSAAPATDLKESFSLPTAPQKPALEKPSVATKSAEAIANTEWPTLVNPIDDPKNFSDEFDWDKDDGLCYPKRAYPVDYDHHH